MSAPIIEFQSTPVNDRPLGRSIWRGLQCRCPNCDKGKLFRKFIKPVDHCENCQEDFSPQRADDLPAYLVVVIIGHIVVGGFLATEMTLNIPGWMQMAIWIPITIVGALALLQPVKGGVIALQWALRMHGFGGHDDSPADPLPNESAV
jgi:uncharacterized protein (DUF983 family)